MAPLHPRRAVAGLALLALWPATAVAADGVSARRVVPPGAAALGPLCTLDTPSFRMWWSDAVGAPGAVAGVDGRCATVPPVVATLATTAERDRARAVALGFPAMSGDAAPVMPRNTALARTLIRSTPRLRAAMLSLTPRTARGAFLAGLTDAMRSRVMAGLPQRLTAALAVDVRRALRGSATDFVGGDRRVDVVVDGRGATGTVRSGQPGLTSCRMRQVAGGPEHFAATWVTILADGPAPVASLAHELFHTVQCRMEAGSAIPTIVFEGTAEWFAATAEPEAFRGDVTVRGTQSTVSGGAARVAGFCSGFDPAGPGMTAYASWGVWDALDRATGGRGVRDALSAYVRVTGPVRPARYAVDRVGSGRWATAVGEATRTLCGEMRSPTATVAFPATTRAFVAGTGVPARLTEPATLTVPRGGVGAAGAMWDPTSPAPVTVFVRSDALGGTALADHLVASTADRALEVRVVADTVAIDVPADALSMGCLTVTVADPLPDAAVSVSVEVHSG